MSYNDVFIDSLNIKATNISCNCQEMQSKLGVIEISSVDSSMFKVVSVVPRVQVSLKQNIIGVGRNNQKISGFKTFEGQHSYSVVSIGESLSYDGNQFSYTIVDILLDAVNFTIESYNWLLVDYECSAYPDKRWLNNTERHFLVDGREFKEILKGKMIQFIWGFVIAYKKDILEESIAKDIKSFNFSNYETFDPHKVSNLSSLEIV